MLARARDGRYIIIELKCGFPDIFDPNPNEKNLLWRQQHSLQTRTYFELWNEGVNRQHYGPAKAAYLYYVHHRKWLRVIQL